jgi:integrase/recombinase XerC
VRYLTDQELQTFLRAAQKIGRKWDAFWSLTYFFAMRAGETAALKVADLDLASHQVTVRPEKGGQSRVYDLPEQIERKLKAWLKERADNPDHAENEFLFPSRLSPRTGHLTNESAWHAFQRTAKKAGLANAHSPHDLRHTRASQMVAAGDTIVQVARWLRHRRTSSSERYLSDLNSAAHEREMAKRAAKFL